MKTVRKYPKRFKMTKALENGQMCISNGVEGISNGVECISNGVNGISNGVEAISNGVEISEILVFKIFHVFRWFVSFFVFLKRFLLIL